MGSLRVGDTVLTPKGRSKIVQIHPLGDQPLYRFYLLDGSETEVTYDHLWSVKEVDCRDRTRQRLITTELIFQSLKIGNRIWIPVYDLKTKKTTEVELLRVQYTHVQKAQCITIEDPAGLYITDGGIVTHNCMSGDTLVIDPKTLIPTPIRDAESFQKTLVFDFEQNKLVWSDCKWFKSGQKPCVRLYLGSGNRLTPSTDHLLVHWRNGWTKAEDLEIGDRIMCPRSIPVFGDLNLDEATLKEFAVRSGVEASIPVQIYSLTCTSLAHFINLLWAEYGRLDRFKSYCTIKLETYDAAKAVQHLLLRFGIDSRVDEGGLLQIDDPIDLSLFLNLVNIKVPILEIHSERRWEIVTGIRRMGPQDVYDLSVDHPDHNFVANNVVVHNSYAMSLLALWHAVMNYDVRFKKTIRNKRVAVWAPSGDQIDEIFDNIDKFIQSNPWLGAVKAKVGNVRDPQERTFTNRSVIHGYILGVSSHLESARRGKGPHTNLVDEAQELTDEQMAVIEPMMVGDEYKQDYVRNYISGTVRNPDRGFYKTIFDLHDEPVDRTYNSILYLPVDKDPTKDDEKLRKLRAQVTNDVTWTREYLLQPVDDEVSVFRKPDIDRAASGNWEYSTEQIVPHFWRVMAVDWDKVGAQTNIVVCQYDPVSKNLSVIYHHEVPRHEFHYLLACKTVIDLWDQFQVNFLIADQGSGISNFEILRKEAQTNGRDDILNNMLMLSLSTKESFIHPETGEIDKRPIKPFIIGLLKQRLMDNKFFFPGSHTNMYNQLLMYKVVKETDRTTIYHRLNEHLVDVLAFCCYGVYKFYEDTSPEQRAIDNASSVHISHDQINSPLDGIPTQMGATIEYERDIYSSPQIQPYRESLDGENWAYQREDF